VSWLCEEFRECPQNANEATVTMYARAWVWHMFATVLFSDSTGDVTFWMYIPALAHWHEVGSYSWGSLVLAYLYHQLCDAYRHRGKTSGLEGYMYLLHVSATTIIYFCFVYFSTVMTLVTCVYFVGLDDDAPSSGYAQTSRTLGVVSDGSGRPVTHCSLPLGRGRHATRNTSMCVH
jgi:hypothetical protein